MVKPEMPFHMSGVCKSALQKLTPLYPPTEAGFEFVLRRLTNSAISVPVVIFVKDGLHPWATGAIGLIALVLGPVKEFCQLLHSVFNTLTILEGVISKLFQ